MYTSVLGRFMSDALGAILAIPGAIDACRNIISALMGQLSQDSHKAHARELEAMLTEIGQGMFRFTDSTEKLRRWKELHNVTQAVLYSDLLETFAFHAEGQPAFTESVPANIETIRKELRQLTGGQRGAFLLLETLSPSDFELEGLSARVKLSGQNWGAHIRALGEKAVQAFSKAQYGSLYTHLKRLQDDCMIMNVQADSQLRDGLGKVTYAFRDVRMKLSAAGLAASG